MFFLLLFAFVASQVASFRILKSNIQAPSLRKQRNAIIEEEASSWIHPYNMSSTISSQSLSSLCDEFVELEWTENRTMILRMSEMKKKLVDARNDGIIQSPHLISPYYPPSSKLQEDELSNRVNEDTIPSITTSSSNIKIEGRNANTVFTELKKRVSTIDDDNEDDSINTSVERFISSYFDKECLDNSDSQIDRSLAAKFQNELLREIFVVHSIRHYKGVTIFNGRFLPSYQNSSKDGDSDGSDTKFHHICSQLHDNFCSHPISEHMRYTIMMNEKIPDMDKGLEEAALDMLLGSNPSIIIYPTVYKSNILMTTINPLFYFWKDILSTFSILSSTIFAISCLVPFANMNDNLNLNVNEWSSIVPILIIPLMMLSLSSFIETIVAKSKGIDVTNTVIPSSSSLLPNFGSRSIYLNMPKNRRDLFDISVVHVAMSYLSSLILMILGIILSTQASSEELLLYPTVPISLFKCNSIVKVLFESIFPGLFFSGGDLIHIHWFAIVGTVSFIGNSLQLLPIDNSYGSKLTLSFLGKDNFEIFDGVINVLKVLILIPVIIISFGDEISAGSKLLIDFLLVSLLVNENYNQVCIDNINGLDRNRKRIFCGVVVFAILQCIPIEYLDRIVATSTMLINDGMHKFPHI